jgi:hypothetical protein
MLLHASPVRVIQVPADEIHAVFMTSGVDVVRFVGDCEPYADLPCRPGR